MWPTVLLIALNVVAHFVPFERAALAPDDYAILLKVQALSFPDLVTTALHNPDRPVNQLVLFCQTALTCRSHGSG